MKNLAECYFQLTGVSLSDMPGAGAAGMDDV